MPISLPRGAGAGAWLVRRGWKPPVCGPERIGKCLTVGETVLERRDEEKRLFLEYRQTGDRRARDALNKRVLPLVRILARRYRRG